MFIPNVVLGAAALATGVDKGAQVDPVFRRIGSLYHRLSDAVALADILFERLGAPLG